LVARVDSLEQLDPAIISMGQAAASPKREPGDDKQVHDSVSVKILSLHYFLLFSNFSFTCFADFWGFGHFIYLK